MFKGATHIILLLVCFPTGSQCVSCSGNETPIFGIKHKVSGKFFHPQGGSRYPDDNTNIVIHSNYDFNTLFKFEPQDNEWGYIVHFSSGKILHPKDGSMVATHEVELVLKSDRNIDAYFAINQTKHAIMHKGGKYIHPYGGHSVPADNTTIVLHAAFHENMQFEFVSPTDTSEEVYVYGEPQICGKWKLINMIINPERDTTDTIEITVGKSNGSADIDISATHSLDCKLEMTSSSTWSDESTVTSEVKASPGQTKVTWQYVYEVTQDEQRGEYHSNIIAHTDSEKKQPRCCVEQVVVL